MPNEASENAAAMQDRIDEVLSWEPGDPIYEQDYDSDWTGASNYLPKIRCTDCEVYWPEPHEPCWSCGKVVPLEESWVRGLVGDDRNTDERLERLSWNIHHFEVYQTIDLPPNFDEMWRNITFSIGPFRAAAQEASNHLASMAEVMRGLSVQQVIFDDVFTLPDFSYRHLALPRQYGRGAFLRGFLDEWSSSDPEQSVVRVQQSAVERVPPTPKVFDFDLGLRKPVVTNFNYDVNASIVEETIFQIPSEIPTKQPPLPVMSDSHLDEINPALFVQDNRFEFTSLSSQLITEMRRSRHIH